VCEFLIFFLFFLEESGRFTNIPANKNTWRLHGLPLALGWVEKMYVP
jgi:hypothetical protein